jgi:hypothetical protein
MSGLIGGIVLLGLVAGAIWFLFIRKPNEELVSGRKALGTYEIGLPVGDPKDHCELLVTPSTLNIRRGRFSLMDKTDGKPDWSYSIPLESVRGAHIEDHLSTSVARVLATGLVGFAWKRKERFLVVDYDNPSGMDVPLILTGIFSPERVVDSIVKAKAALATASTGSTASDAS